MIETSQWTPPSLRRPNQETQSYPSQLSQEHAPYVKLPDGHLRHTRGTHLVTKNDLTLAYGQASRPFQVTSAGEVEYDYDANGNQIGLYRANHAEESQTLSYDPFNMPRRVVMGDEEESGAKVTELEYAPNGARLLKRTFAPLIEGQPAQVAREVLDIAEMYQRVAEYDPSSGQLTTLRHSYRVHAGGRQVAQVNKVEEGGALDPDETRILYLHDNHLGSTDAISDQEGTLVERRTFTAFGEAKEPTWDYGSTQITSGFTGHQHDDELGLVNMRGRIYDPRIGRSLSADPFTTDPVTPQGLNRYAYVENDPINTVDPSGFAGEQPSGSSPQGWFEISSWGGGGATEETSGSTDVEFSGSAPIPVP